MPTLTAFLAAGRAGACPAPARACQSRGAILRPVKTTLGSSHPFTQNYAPLRAVSVPWRARRVDRTRVAAGGGGSDALSAASQLARSPLYRVWLQLGVVLVIFMLIDAAYSGDWSRIGVITTDQEAQLKELSIALGCFHLACGAVAATASSRRGELRWPQRTAKVLAVGFLALVEVLLVAEEGVEGA